MEKQQKKKVKMIVIALGVLSLIIGFFTNFMYGVFVALAIWILGGLFMKFMISDMPSKPEAPAEESEKKENTANIETPDKPTNE